MSTNRLFVMLAALLILAAGGAYANGPSNVLVYDHNTKQHVATSAMTQLGWSYTPGDSSTFNGLLTGGTPWDIVVVDCPSTEPGYVSGSTDWNPFTNYVNGGGRAVLSFWDLDQHSGLATAFGVSVYQDFFSPQNVYRWDTTDPVFSGVTDLTQWLDLWDDDGDYLTLTPTNGGTALAGFTTTPQANDAAIVRDNGGRTYVNGFLFDETATATAPFDNMVDLVANECSLAYQEYGQPSGPDDSPELATWALLACTGGIGAAIRRRRRK